jgi:hypothetical protein
VRRARFQSLEVKLEFVQRDEERKIAAFIHEAFLIFDRQQAAAVHAMNLEAIRSQFA